jgi:hypothetical protein
MNKPDSIDRVFGWNNLPRIVNIIFDLESSDDGLLARHRYCASNGI